MNNLKMLLIKSSWSYLLLQSEEASDVFYDQLFELNPPLKALFKHDMKAQGKKLVDMITLIVTNLQSMENILPEIHALGKRHLQYGTRPEHYDMVGEALLWTLKNFLSDKWDDQMADAWHEVYTFWAKEMITGSMQH